MKRLSHLLFPLALLVLLVISGAGCTKKAKEARHWQKAEKFYAAGDYDSAEVEYINVLRLNPQAAGAYTRWGIMAFEQGRLGLAYGALLKGAKLDTNNLEVHDTLGLFYLTAGERGKAREEANYVLTRKPDDDTAPLLLADSGMTLNEIDVVRQRLQSLAVPPAKRAAVEVALGTLAFRERDFKAAAAAFERARGLDPKFGPLYGALGSLYVEEKNPRQAEEAFKFAAETAPLRSHRRLVYAQFKIQSGDVAGGRTILEELWKKVPDYLPAGIALAGTYGDEKKFDAAREVLAKVMARDQNNFEALLLGARMGMIQGDYATAVTEYEKMVKTFSKSPQLFYQLGLAYNGENDTPKAMAALNQAITLSPGYAEAIIALAQIKIAKGDVSSAVVALKQLVQQRPKLPDAQLILADAYKQLGQLDDAVKIYRKLEEEYPKNAQTPSLLGSVLRLQGRSSEARKEIAKSLELAPEYLTAQEQMAELDVDDKQYAAALQRVQKEIEKEPKVPELQLLLAQIYMAQGDSRQATAILLKTIEAQPDYSPGYFTLARVYLAAKQNQQALDTLHTLLAKHPKEPGAWMLLATIQDQLKDVKAAREAYEKVVELEPKNIAALNNLAYLYSEHGELEKGYDLARRAREVAPFDSSAADTLGWILYKKRDYPQALILLKESAAKQPNAADIQYHLGMVHYMSGDEDAASASLKFAGQSKQDFPGKEEAARCVAIMAVDVKSAGPDAITLLEKRVAEQPADATAYSRLAAIYQHDGKTDKAIAAYETVLKLNPKNLRALMELARLYSSQPDQRDKAFEFAKAAYKIAPEDPKIDRMLGRLAYQTGDFKWSVNLLQEASRRLPADPELAYDLGEAEYSRGLVADAQTQMQNALQSGANFSRAAAAKQFLDLLAIAAKPVPDAQSQVDQCLKSNPDYVPALMAQGALSEQKGDTHAATQSYEKALSRYPDFVPAKRQLTILYAQEPGDDKQALALGLKAREVYSEDADLARALGIINYRLGDYAASQKLLKESALKKSGDAQLMYYLGMDQYQLKQRADSKKSLLQAVDLKLPEKLAAEARRVLAELN